MSSAIVLSKIECDFFWKYIIIIHMCITCSFKIRHQLKYEFSYIYT